jgi:glycosyltransferase involved in cell wall biosynthesis
MAGSKTSERGVGVCIVVENMTVPADRRVWREATTLTQAGYSVSVVCPKGFGFDRSRETIDGVEIYRHSTCEASGLFGYFIEYIWALIAEIVLVFKVYARTRFRILQACNPPDTIFVIALVLRSFGVRFIFDQHDPLPEFYEAKFGRRDVFYRAIRAAERLTFQAADVTIVTNESCRHLAITRGGVKPENCFVVQNFPRLTDFPAEAPSLRLKEGFANMVLYVGVMGSQDGLNLLLQSIHTIVNVERREDTVFVIVGGGPELPTLKAQATKLGIDRFVRFTGMLYGNDLRAYFAAADLGVSPDPYNVFNDKLTMIKIVEYMACGLPVVLFDLAEGRRSACDAALYATGNDPVNFAERITTLLDSPSMRRELGQIGRRRIQTRLNWETETRSLLAAYRAALGPSASPQAQKEEGPLISRSNQ